MHFYTAILIAGTKTFHWEWKISCQKKERKMKSCSLKILCVEWWLWWWWVGNKIHVCLYFYFRLGRNCPTLIITFNIVSSISLSFCSIICVLINLLSSSRDSRFMFDSSIFSRPRFLRVSSRTSSCRLLFSSCLSLWEIVCWGWRRTVAWNSEYREIESQWFFKIIGKGP